MISFITVYTTAKLLALLTISSNNHNNKEILLPTINYLIKYIEWVIRSRNRQNLQMFQSQLTTDNDSTYIPYIDCSHMYACVYEYLLFTAILYLHALVIVYKHFTSFLQLFSECMHNIHMYSCMYVNYSIVIVFVYDGIIYCSIAQLWSLQVRLLCVPLAHESLESLCRYTSSFA